MYVCICIIYILYIIVGLIVAIIIPFCSPKSLDPLFSASLSAFVPFSYAYDSYII